jgi:hypothetical protein
MQPSVKVPTSMVDKSGRPSRRIFHWPLRLLADPPDAFRGSKTIEPLGEKHKPALNDTKRLMCERSMTVRSGWA